MFSFAVKHLSDTPGTGFMASRAKGARLAPYDAEVEWLESTGTQWIDTGVSIPADHQIAMFVDGQFTSTTSGTYAYCSVVAENTAQRSRFGIGWRDPGTWSYPYGNYGNILFGAADTSRHTFRLDAANGTYGVDQTTYSCPQTDGWGTDYTIYLFAANNWGSAAGFASMRIYGAKFYKNGVLVRDLIPVRKNDIGYLYDKVSGQFFGNQGTGAFLYGGDVPSYLFKPVLRKYGIRTSYTVDEANGSDPYSVEAVFPSGTYSALDYTPVKSGYRFAGWSDGTELPYDSEVEYLESTGTQYIDTGVLGSSDVDFEVRFCLPTMAGRQIMGQRKTGSNTLANFIQTQSSPMGKVRVFYGASENSVYYTATSGEWVTVRRTGTSFYTNDVLTGTVSASTFTAENTIIVHGTNGFSTYGTAQLRISVAKIWQNGVLVRDFISVRKNGVGYLFDKVSGQLFGNQGTGSFLYGGDIPFTNLSRSDPIRYGLSNVYAVWQLPVTVTFDATTNGGAMPSGWVAPYYYGGQPYGTLPTPTKADNVFLGWFTATGERVTASTTSPYTQHTLTARYAVPTYDTSFEVTTTSSYRKAGIYAANSRNTANPTIVDWGGGSIDVVYGNISQLAHTYSSNGTFTVRVNDNISSFALSVNDSTWYGTTSQNQYTVKKVTAIGSNVTSIPTYAFYYCSAMTDAVLPTTISSVPNYCFYYCSALKGITIPSNYTSIEQYAFYYCNSSSFTSVTIPAAITSIGTYAFGYCQYLHDITFESSSSALTLGTYAFYRCFYQSSAVGTIDLSPRKITSIPNYCFCYCRYLKGIIWPQNLTSIGASAFRYCFYYADSTGTVEIPEGVTSFSSTYAFANCLYLTAVTLPSTITNLNNYAFYYCTRLATITCNRSTAPTVSAATFGNSATYYTGRNSYSAGTNRLYVPSGATGYTSSYWGSVLLDSTKCGFTLEELVTITFDPGSGNGTPFTRTFPANVAQTLPTENESGFTNDDVSVHFSSWNTSADGTGTDYVIQPDASYTFSQSITLYPRWFSYINQDL